MAAYSVAITSETRRHSTIYDVGGALHISTFTEIVKCWLVVATAAAAVVVVVVAGGAAIRKPLEK